MATYHMTVARKHVPSKFIHIYTVIFCTVGRPCLSCSSLQVSAHIAHHSKVLLKLIQKLILPLLYPYVAETVDDREERSYLTYKQTQQEAREMCAKLFTPSSEMTCNKGQLTPFLVACSHRATCCIVVFICGDVINGVCNQNPGRPPLGNESVSFTHWGYQVFREMLLWERLHFMMT